MAFVWKLDWETSRDALNALIGGTSFLEEDIAQAIVDEMDLVGIPYDAVYDQTVDDSKGANVSLINSTIQEWYDEAQGAHNQATHGLNFVETKYTDLEEVTYPPFSSVSSTLATNRGLIESKLKVYAAKTQYTENKVGGWDNDGEPEVLQRYLREFITAYDAYSQPTWVGPYGAELLVAVPGKGLITVYQAETILFPLIHEAERMVEMINY